MDTNSEEERDGRLMRVQFFWQPSYQRGQQAEVDFISVPIEADTAEHNGFNESWRMYDEMGKIVGQIPIQTGHIFEITTHNPERLPLPSRDLLDMQYKLQRALALRAAGENFQDDEDDRDHQDLIMVSAEQHLDIQNWLNSSEMPALRSSEMAVLPEITSHWSKKLISSVTWQPVERWAKKNLQPLL